MTSKIAGLSLSIFLLLMTGLGYYIYNYAEVDLYVLSYNRHCADCHGGDLKGRDGHGPSLLAESQAIDQAVDQIMARIAQHDIGLTPDLTPDQVKGLAIFIAERRLGLQLTEFRFDTHVQPTPGVVTTRHHAFTIEVFADDLAPIPFSIEPLPDGSMLLTEKVKGLSIISPEGIQSAYISGTPDIAGVTGHFRGLQYGVGWLLDVAVHPNYSKNGWVYLHYTELCGPTSTNLDCPANTLLPISMNRLDRGRIIDGRWTDVETIWRSDHEFYTGSPDSAAGGRIAFDDSGHVYISVGIKTMDPFNDTSPQSLNSPYGKIHRMMDNGDIPADNPFLITTAIRDHDREVSASIWTVGHRSPQGLEWHPGRAKIWNAEMGPRGGDELNELHRGGNYGWPFHSQGQEYTAVAVQRHVKANLEFDADQSIKPLVDFTPSPAISSFVFYEGAPFAAWQGQVLIGSLKGQSLFRLAFDGDKLVHKETLIKDLARIRDIEIGDDGLVYLLVESEHGSKILRLRPAT